MIDWLYYFDGLVLYFSQLLCLFLEFDFFYGQCMMIIHIKSYACFIVIFNYTPHKNLRIALLTTQHM